MKLQILRLPQGPDYMDGVMLLDGQYYGQTVEDAPRPVKVMHKTAIPKGRYVVTVELSPRFKVDLPRLHDVPGFDGVLIHGGNTADDSSGCILIASNRIGPGKIQGSLSNDLTQRLKKAQGPHTIEILEAK